MHFQGEYNYSMQKESNYKIQYKLSNKKSQSIRAKSTMVKNTTAAKSLIKIILNASAPMKLILIKMTPLKTLQWMALSRIVLIKMALEVI